MPPPTNDGYWPVSAIFDHLLRVLPSQRFLTMQGLGNEVPFFICPFDPAQQRAMADAVANLKTRLAQSHPGIRVLSIDLFDLTLELLQKRNVLEQLLAQEALLEKDRLLALMRNVCDAERHLAPFFAEQLAAHPHDIIFVTGVARVFPFIRTHNLLNNLQSVAKAHPLLLFFPGNYRHSPEGGASLELFGRLHSDKYYRAFNILHRTA